MSAADASPADGPGVRALLASVDAIRRRTRHDRQGWWLALVAFGVAEAAALPVYLTRPRREVGGWQPLTAFHGPGLWGISPPFAPGEWSGLYWLIALPLAYLLTWWWYARRARRTGLASPLRAFTVVGAALLALLLLTLPATAAALHLPASSVTLLPLDMTVRGLAPQLVVAAGLMVLVVTERSRPLGLIVAAYTAIAVVANLYDLQYLYYRAGGPPLGGAEMIFNVLTPAALLLVAGLWAGARRRWR